MAKLCEQQKQILRKGKEIQKKQKNQEFWIKTTRYLAFAFLVVRITFFVTSTLLKNFQYLVRPMHPASKMAPNVEDYIYTKSLIIIFKL